MLGVMFWSALSITMIYFIKASVTRKIKIGFTNQTVDERLSCTKSNSPDELTFLGGFPGCRKVEANLHKRFSKYLSHGEWYNEHDEIYQFIDENCLKKKFSFDWICESLLNEDITLAEAVLLTDKKVKQLSEARVKHAFRNLWSNVKFPDQT